MLPPGADKTNRQPDKETLEKIHGLLETGRYLSAWKLAGDFAPLRSREDPKGRITTARLSGWGRYRYVSKWKRPVLFLPWLVATAATVTWWIQFFFG